MAGVYTFHNKYHRSSHHSITGFGLDGGTDPIASYNEPFLGIFYNTLTDNNRSFVIQTDSYQWWLAYNIVNTLSGNWAPTLSLYTTVNSLSDLWNLGYTGYLTLQANSATYESVFTTVCANSAAWSEPNIMFTNRVQEYTHSKTFSGTNLTYVTGLSTVDWDVSLNQVTFFALLSDTFINNPTNLKKGGTYVLSLSQNNLSPLLSGRSVYFSTAYRFPIALNYTGVINLSSYRTAVISFLCDGTLMYGDIIFYLE